MFHIIFILFQGGGLKVDVHSEQSESGSNNNNNNPPNKHQPGISTSQNQPSTITPLQLVESATALNVIARNTQQIQPVNNNSAITHSHLTIPDSAVNSGGATHKKLARTNSGHRQIQRTKEKEELSRRPSYKRIFDELKTAGESQPQDDNSGQGIKRF